jgi:hypothetical protein
MSAHLANLAHPIQKEKSHGNRRGSLFLNAMKLI